MHHIEVRVKYCSCVQTLPLRLSSRYALRARGINVKRGSPCGHGCLITNVGMERAEESRRENERGRPSPTERRGRGALSSVRLREWPPPRARVPSTAFLGRTGIKLAFSGEAIPSLNLFLPHLMFAFSPPCHFGEGKTFNSAAAQHRCGGVSVVFISFAAARRRIPCQAFFGLPRP